MLMLKLLVLVSGLLCIVGTATAERRVLSDSELGAIIGGDVCGDFFGLSGPCTVSYYEVFEPTNSPPTTFVKCSPSPCTATTPPPIGSVPNTTSTAGVSVSGTVKVKQSYQSTGTSISQRQKVR